MEEKNKELDKKILETQNRIFRLQMGEIIFIVLLAIVILGSLLFLILLQFYSSSPKYRAAAEITNTFVGIALGFVAMAVSLLSMVLGFHNTKQTEKSNLESTKEFARLAKSTQEIKDLEKELSKNLDNLKNDLDKLTQLDQIRSELKTLVKDIQGNVDIQKGSQTTGVINIQVGNNDQTTSQDDEFDDIN